MLPFCSIFIPFILFIPKVGVFVKREELKSTVKDSTFLRIKVERQFLIEVKKHAIERRISMRQYVIEALTGKMLKDKNYI